MAVRKAIYFDLEQSELKKHYDRTPTNAYKEIQTFFEKNGFEHCQGSGYVSKLPLAKAVITNLLKKLGKQLPWISKCAKQMDVTNIGKQYSVMNVIQAGAESVKDTADNITRNILEEVARKRLADRERISDVPKKAEPLPPTKPHNPTNEHSR